MLANVACQQILSKVFRETGQSFAKSGSFKEAIQIVITEGRFWLGGGLAAMCLVLWA